MNLKVMTPERVLLETAADKIVARSPDGYFCLLPRHIDYVSILAPGILSYQYEQGVSGFAAVDYGTLVKSGDEVLVSTRHAVAGEDLDELLRIVVENFGATGESELAARAIAAKWESEFTPKYLKAR